MIQTLSDKTIRSRLKDLVAEFADDKSLKQDLRDACIKGFLVGPCVQHPYEMYELLSYLRDKDVNTFVEIGVYRGGTFALWSYLFPHAFKVGIDLAIENEIKRTFSAFKVNDAHLVEGCSTSKETVKKVERVLYGRPVDFLFIDGCHSYDAVVADYRN